MTTTIQQTKKNTKAIWEYPWQYKESYLIALGLLVSGFLIEFSAGDKKFAIPEWPYNGYLVISFTLILTGLHLVFRKSNFVKWLSGVPAAISSISLVTFLVLLMGIFPQNKDIGNGLNIPGLNNITRSWPYLLSILYFLSCLGLVSLRRITSFSSKNLGFFLNHLGLWIAVIAGSAGTGDVRMLSMELHEGEIKHVAADSSGTKFELPFAIQLIDFSLQEYEPKIGLLDYKKSELLIDDRNQPFYSGESNTGELMGKKIKILKYLHSAGKFGNRYEPFIGTGAPPAALIEITDSENNEKLECWLSCGNFMNPPDYYKIDSTYSIIMIPPEPKKFTSDVIVFSELNKDSVSIEVNKPFKIAGWKIYQSSYNEELGKYSNTSTFELVHDPWLPAVYTGIFLMMAGAIYLLATGKRRAL